MACDITVTHTPAKDGRPRIRLYPGEKVHGKLHTDKASALRSWRAMCRKGHRARIVTHRGRLYSVVIQMHKFTLVKALSNQADILAKQKGLTEGEKMELLGI